MWIPAIRGADGRVIRSIDFYNDLAKWTAIEVIESIGQRVETVIWHR
jgi:hypothetical protein